jgi:hypothetical protein
MHPAQRRGICMAVGAMKRLFGRGLGAAALVASTLARAQDPAPPAQQLPPLPPGVTVVSPAGPMPDAVHLKDGGVVRGTVHELLPGGHVTIAEPSGRLIVVPWAQIDKVALGARAGGGANATATPVPAPSPPSDAGKRAKSGPLVRVHIESPRSVQLYRRPAGDDGWYEACSAPCEEDLPLGDLYRISGPGIEQSHEFSLEGSPGGRVLAKVDPSTRAAYTTGAIITAVGGLVDYVGLMVLASAASTECSSSSYGASCQHSPSGNGATVGGAMLLGGTIAAAVGVVMMLANNSTSVTVSAASPPGSASAKPLDAFKREATFRETSGPAAPGGFLAPTWIVRF